MSFGRSTYKGRFTPKNPKKYGGDASNIIYRSLWERKLFKLFDEHPSVLVWSSEEVIIPYLSPIDGRMHRYFPDVFAKLKTNEGEKFVLIEIKPFKETQVPVVTKNKRKKTLLMEQTTFAINMAKWEAAQAYCQQRNWEFKVMTEKELF